MKLYKANNLKLKEEKAIGKNRSAGYQQILVSMEEFNIENMSFNCGFYEAKY